MNTKPFKKTNYTRFNDIEGANDYARANEKDLQNIFQYVGNMGLSQDVTIGAVTMTFVNGVLTKVV